VSPVVLAAIAAWQVVVCSTTQEWLAARHRFLTASDVAAVLGMHPHKSRAAVLKDKRAAFEPSTRPPVKAMRAGHFLEPAVLDWFADDCRLNTSNPRQYVAHEQCRNPEGTSLLVRYADPDLRLAASPDGVLLFREPDGSMVNELAEIKCHGPRQWALWDEPSKSRAWPGARLGVPLQHWVQLQTQLLCCGEQAGWVVGNCGSERLEKRFDADPAFHARIIEATCAFWREVHAV
jgi:hypothetical protein